jgi:acetoin utilization protein AcuB
MYAGLKMLRDVVTITPLTLVVEANRLMEKHRQWVLFVLDGEKLAGYVTMKDIRGALPSVTTTLSKHELSYLLSKLTVADLVRRDVPVIHPEAEIELAAEVMSEKNLQALAVVDPNGQLLGVVSRTVMLDVLVEEMGLQRGGARIVFETAERTGVIHDVSGVIARHGVSIISASTFYHGERRMVVIRMETDDPEPINAELRQKGYALLTADDFASEWQ